MKYVQAIFSDGGRLEKWELEPDWWSDWELSYSHRPPMYGAKLVKLRVGDTDKGTVLTDYEVGKDDEEIKRILKMVGGLPKWVRT